jgi:hypothetical protein
MKISNDIFKTIFDTFESKIDTLYKEESACVLIFRILPELCQHVITRIIYVDDEIKYTFENVIEKINWSDIFETDPVDGIKRCWKILFKIKIIPTKDMLILHPDFKKNMLKIFSSGFTTTGILVKKKKKDWSETFNAGIEALEKFLKLCFNLDKIKLIDQNEPEWVKFLLNIKFVKKEGGLYKLSNIALTTLLGDKQLQIRQMIGKYIQFYRIGHTEEEMYKFLRFLFVICTKEVGAVNIILYLQFLVLFFRR